MHVVGGVGQLLRRQRAPRPVGPGLALVDRVPELPGNELGVADLRRVAEQRGGDLGVEHRPGQPSPGLVQDLEVLSGGVQDLELATVGEQLVQRAELEPGQRVHQVAVRVAGELHQAQLCVVGPLPHELGVEREAGRALHPEHGCLEFRLCRDESRFPHDLPACV